MKEITVETTGNFMLLDRFSGREIPASGSVTVPLTTFVQERLDNGDLQPIGLTEDEIAELLANVPETETETQTETEEAAEETDNDKDDDGHDDTTGQFVEGNQEAAAEPAPKPTKRAKRGGNA